ncbi:MAG TPA: YceI family protein [Burkholderiales bacterium]|nr:YceI family protein [Burkholderiales bacterium]
MQRLAIPVVAALLVAASAWADTVDYQKSRIGFTFRQMNVPVEGQFPRFSASMAFDAATPEASRVEIEVDLASIDTGSTDGDTEVKRKLWFNVASFPKAKFTSTAIKPLGGNRYEVAGTLGIKGRSRDLKFPVTLKPEAGGTLIEGGFPLLRLQFGIGEAQWSDTETVADEVQVRFRIFASAAVAPGSSKQH